MSDPAALPRAIGGLSEIAGNYDALICDIWGVLHNGRHAFAAATDALIRFRRERGPVVLLSNAPRLPDNVAAMLDALHVPREAYDGIVTSGGVAHVALAERLKAGPLSLLHIGPERDRPVFVDLPIRMADEEAADVALCTGLYDDEAETPDDYRPVLEKLLARGLAMLCANPDIVVMRGDKLIYCAGAIARLYEEMGGHAVYYGKPYRPVYDVASAFLQTKGPAKSVLAIGDAIETDIKGARNAGFDALFIAGGIHSAEIGGDFQALAALFAESGLGARAAMNALAW
jgi:HAD superfamily hydrolase (TIGR01459 family)